MSDLYIDGAMLKRVRSNLSRIVDLLNGPARAMRDVDGSDVGPERLVNRVRDFGHEWEYGIGQLGKFSGSAVEALDSIEKAFDDADVKLADALRDAGKKS